MENQGKASLLLNEIMRFCAVHNTPNEGSDDLRLILKNLQEGESASAFANYRALVFINAGMTCLDEHSRVKVEITELRTKIFFLVYDTQMAKEQEERKRLFIETLVKAKVLSQASQLATKLCERVKEFTLKAQTEILAVSEFQAENSSYSESTIALQLMAYRDLAAAARASLEKAEAAQTTKSPINASVTQGSSADREEGERKGEVDREEAGEREEVEAQCLSFDELVARQSLSAVIDFSKNWIARAQSFCEQAACNMTRLADIPPDNATVLRGALLAYAMTGAAVAEACSGIVQDAQITYGKTANFIS